MNSYKFPPTKDIGTRIPPPKKVKLGKIQFSFTFYDPNHTTSKKVTFDNKYPKKFVNRLRELEDWTVEKFAHFRENNYHIHSIKWKDTRGEFNGFGLSSEYDENAWQFSISGSNKYGRVQGFFIENVFHVVWLDPKHIVYPGR